MQRPRNVSHLRFNPQLFLMAIRHDGNDTRRINVEAHRGIKALCEHEWNPLLRHIPDRVGINVGVSTRQALELHDEKGNMSSRLTTPGSALRPLPAHRDIP